MKALTLSSCRRMMVVLVVVMATVMVVLAARMRGCGRSDGGDSDDGGFGFGLTVRDR